MSPPHHSDKAERKAEELYEKWQHRAVGVKIRAQMVIGAFIILSLVSLLVLQAIRQTGDVTGVDCPKQPEWWPVGFVCKIHDFFVQIFFVPPLELVGYALVLSAGVELAYMLYTDGPDEALDPLILGLAAAALLAVSQIKTNKASWQLALFILVLSAAVGFLLYIRHAYAPVERVESTLRERVALLERHVDTLKRELEQVNGAPQVIPQEVREAPQTAEERPERAEPRPDAGGAQEGAGGRTAAVVA
jgi:hypothetical protein